MKRATLLRGASVALAAASIACGDSTAPNVTLTDAQVGDMLDAITAVSLPGAVPGTGMFIHRTGETANVTVTLAETVSCPNGGSAAVNGTATSDPINGTFSAQITQGFTACAAPSEQGRVWTFDGNPNIVTNLSGTHNVNTGAFSLTATQVGGVKFSSNLGAGTCALDLSLTASGNDTSGTVTLSGTACGRTIQRTVTITE